MNHITPDIMPDPTGGDRLILRFPRASTASLCLYVIPYSSKEFFSEFEDEEPLRETAATTNTNLSEGRTCIHIFAPGLNSLIHEVVHAVQHSMSTLVSDDYSLALESDMDREVFAYQVADITCAVMEHIADLGPWIDQRQKSEESCND